MIQLKIFQVCINISFKMLSFRANIHIIALNVESGSVHIKLYLGKHEAYSNKDPTMCDLWSHHGFIFFFLSRHFIDIQNNGTESTLLVLSKLKQIG